jgi:hypothetical protein
VGIEGSRDGARGRQRHEAARPVAVAASLPRTSGPPVGVAAGRPVLVDRAAEHRAPATGRLPCRAGSG